MELKDIMAISGHSGLFKFISQGRHGIIVESLSDGKRTNVSASAKVSSLSDIAIFTNDAEVPFKDVLKKIKEAENNSELRASAIDAKAEVEPEFDDDGEPTGNSRPMLTMPEDDAP